MLVLILLIFSLGVSVGNEGVFENHKAGSGFIEVTVDFASIGHKTSYSVHLFSDTNINLANAVIAQKCTNQNTINDDCNDSELYDSQLNQASQTVRYLKVENIKREESNFLESLHGDSSDGILLYDNFGELYSLTYAYDYLPRHRRKRVCIFGLVQISTLLLILLSNHIDENEPVLRFIESEKDFDKFPGSWKQADKLFEHYNRTSILIKGGFKRSVENLYRDQPTSLFSRGQSAVCDIVHISTTTGIEKESYQVAEISQVILSGVSEQDHNTSLTIVHADIVHLGHVGYMSNDGQLRSNVPALIDAFHRKSNADKTSDASALIPDK